MRGSLSFVMVALFLSLDVQAELSFDGIPSAENLKETRLYQPLRRQRVLEYRSSQSLPLFQKKGATSLTLNSIARLALDQDVETVNLRFLDPGAKVYGKVGTDLDAAGGLCKRNGDYDFMLVGLIPLYYRFKDRLWPQTREKILDRLLNTRGTKHHKRIYLGLCGWHRDTENHILMTETSRYLTNQLLYRKHLKQGVYRREYDNRENGFEEWMLRHLRHFMIEGFEEYNSKPYGLYTLFALLNLYDFSISQRVKLGARLVIDQIMMRFAVQSYQGRRSVPFRRQPQHRNNANLFDRDGIAAAFLYYLGNHQIIASNQFRVVYGDHVMTRLAVSDYRLPRIVKRFVFDRDRLVYEQRIGWGGIETFSAGRNFLISGGGRFRNFLDAGTGKQDAWAMPIALIPDAQTWNRDEMIRIRGHKNEKYRSNLCVAQGFACGIAPTLPSHMPESCRYRHGDWTFLNLDASCPLNWGIRVVVFSKKCDSLRCKRRGKRFGFFSVASADEISFAEFRSRILDRNRRTRYRANHENTFVTHDNRWIRFQPVPYKMQTWPIVSINGWKMQRDSEKWRGAEGDVLNTPAKGVFTFTHPGRNLRVTLDYSDPLHPIKRFENLN